MFNFVVKPVTVRWWRCCMKTKTSSWRQVWLVMFSAFNQCLSSVLYQVLTEDVKYWHLCFWEKETCFLPGHLPLKASPLCFFAFILFGGCQYFSIVFHGPLYSCKMDCLDFATFWLPLGSTRSRIFSIWSIHVQIPIFLGYTGSFHARGKKI